VGPDTNQKGLRSPEGNAARAKKNSYPGRKIRLSGVLAYPHKGGQITASSMKVEKEANELGFVQKSQEKQTTRRWAQREVAKKK